MILSARSTQIPGMTTHMRLSRLESMKPPIGVAISMPATLPIVIAVPISPLGPPTLLQEDPDERSDAGLHVGHEEIDCEQGPKTGNVGSPCHRNVMRGPIDVMKRRSFWPVKA